MSGKPLPTEERSMSQMQTYAVYLSEYPEEGCTLIEAVSKEDAIKQWYEETGTPPSEDPELNVSVATPALLAVLAAEEAKEAAEAAYQAARKVFDAEQAAIREKRAAA